MSETRACARCGSTDLIPDAKVEDRTDHVRHELEVLVGHRHPDALVFTDPIRAELRAEICGHCGHVALFVRDPEALWAAWKSAPRQEPP